MPDDLTGRDVLRRRLAMGLSQGAIADLLQYDRKTIGGWESGRVPVAHARTVDLALSELERRMAGATTWERLQAALGFMPPEHGGGALRTIKVYLAARYSEHPKMQRYAKDLEELGCEVTSRWIQGGHEWVGVPDEEMPVSVGAGFAKHDLEGLDRADVVVCFTEPSRAKAGRGGRHVEYGYALAKGKAIVIVGHRENVFYCLDNQNGHNDTLFVESWMKVLWAIREVQAALAGRDAPNEVARHVMRTLDVMGR